MRYHVKRIIAICLVICMMLSTSLVGNAQNVSNDYSKHWAGNEIEKWDSLGLLENLNVKGVFEPDKAIKRAEFVALVNRVFNFSIKSADVIKDVSEKEWYYDDVIIAFEAGYVAGDGKGNFRPEAPLTRQEAAVILSKVFKLKVQDKEFAKLFSDFSKMSSWSVGAISALAEKGYIANKKGLNFSPVKNTTRAEAVKMLDNIAGELKIKAGTYTGDINRNLVINTKNVVLKDMNIKGNLYLTEGIGNGNVTLENVHVQGQTFVSGGGENSIILTNTNLTGALFVEKKDGKVRIVANGTTEVASAELNSGAKLEENNNMGKGFAVVQILKVLASDQIIKLDGDFTEISIEMPGVKVELADGSVGKLNVTDKAIGANVSITKGIVSEINTSGKASKIQIAEGAQVTTLNANAELEVSGKGKIKTANINSNNVSIAQKPESVIVASNIIFDKKPESSTPTNTDDDFVSPTPTPTPTPIPTPTNSSTDISVKDGSESIVTGIWSSTLKVAYSTTATQLVEAVQSTDGSNQTYEVIGKLMDRETAVLMTTNKLKVTAEDGSTTAEYEIIVEPLGDIFMLTPVSTTTGSEASGSEAVKATNNSGMSGYYGAKDSHDNNGQAMWLTENNPGVNNWIQVDLGAIYPLGKMLVWNYNKPGAINNGIKNAQILYSTDGITWNCLGGANHTQQFAQASGAAAERSNAVLDFGGRAGRYVKILPNTESGNGNWGGTAFGLSQLRIYRYSSNVTTSGQNVTVLNVIAGSQYSLNTPAINTVNNYGMSGVSGKTDTHSNIDTEMWRTALNPGSSNWIQFDLGGTYPLSEMQVWNYNAQSGEYGIRNAQVQYSIDGRNWTTLGSYEFARASGMTAQGPTNLVGGGVVNFNASSARYIKIIPNTAIGDGNWGSNVVFGLSQVRFYSAPGTIIEPAREWTDLVTKTTGWTGSDGIYTIPYNGFDAPGRADETKTLFLFSDTFIGNANPVSKEREVYDFTNNTLGVLTGGNADPSAMDFIWGMDADGKTTNGLFEPNTPNAQDGDWYWLQDGINFDDGNIYISAMNVTTDPLQPPGWQFRVAGVSMIKVPLINGELQIENQTQVDTPLLYHTEFEWGTKPDGSPNMLSLENQFGAGFMANTTVAGAPNPDGYIYIYGYQTCFGVRGLLVARVHPEDFEDFSKWEYYGSIWGAKGWYSDAQAANSIQYATPISNSSIDVSPELSVTPIIGGPNNGKYMLVYSTGLFSEDHGLIKCSIGDTPAGPFGPPTTLYYTPEDKTSANSTYIYNAKAHPSISKPGELLITYNINSTQDSNYVHYANGDLYHPRFLVMRPIFDGTNTDLSIKDGNEGVVSSINNSSKTINVNEGTTVAELVNAVCAADWSPQIYDVHEELNGVLLSGGTVLSSGNILKVIAIDNSTIENYTISVNPPVSANTDISTKEGKETVATYINNDVKTINVASGTNVDSLIVAIDSFDLSDQSYEVYPTLGSSKITDGSTVLTTGNILKVIAENGVASSNYTIYINPLPGENITGVNATSGSNIGFGLIASKTIDNSGMSGISGQKSDTCDGTNTNMWLSADNIVNTDNWIGFDLGGTYMLGEMYVWNYNEKNQSKRGIKNATVEYSTDGTNWTTLGGSGHTYQFSQALGTTVTQYATNLVDGGIVDFGGVSVKYVRITPNADIGDGNWGGFWMQAGRPVFGLSEVRFYTAQLP